MKKDIHPKYYDAKVTCACGNSFTVGASVEKINVEICSACHPFFTGNEKVVDTAGMVEKFKGRAAKATKTTASKKTSKPASAEASAGK
jgi:large subunit ribosomal protein L31